MLEQLIGQLFILTILLSVLGWMLGNMAGQRKQSPFWLIGWLVKRGFRILRAFSKGASKRLYELRSKLLKIQTNSSLGQIFCALIGTFIGITGMIVAIPAVIIGELPIGNKRS